MSDITKYVPLKRVVANALDEEDKSIADFDKWWGFAFRGLVDIYTGMTAEPITVRLPVMGNKTVVLPSDYIMWSKIGVMGSDGKVATIKINNTLSKFRSNNPNRLEDLQSTVDNNILGDLSTYPYFLNFYQNGSFTPLFGLPNGLIQYGQCAVDEKNNIIVLDPGFQYPDIVVEYISSPEKNNDYQVEMVVQEALISFIKWKAKLGSEVDYHNRKREARRKMYPIRSQEINEAIRANAGYKIKA